MTTAGTDSVTREKRVRLATATASRPAARAASPTAAGTGMPASSTSAIRPVLMTAPMSAAAKHTRWGELKRIAKP